MSIKPYIYDLDPPDRELSVYTKGLVKQYGSAAATVSGRHEHTDFEQCKRTVISDLRIADVELQLPRTSQSALSEASARFLI